MHGRHYSSKGSAEFGSVQPTHCPVGILAGSPDILAEIFRGFPQSLQLNSGKAPQAEPTNASFRLISNSLFTIIQPFGAILLRFVVVKGKGVPVLN
jgi:hypothetical protein